MKIVELKAKNIRGLKTVHVTPEGDVVEVSGPNSAGKSSLMDAAWFALSGAAAAKGMGGAVLREGTEDGYAYLNLGNLEVERRITADGKTSLKVYELGEDGLKSPVQRPQAVLDGLRAFGLDPVEFISLTGKERRDTVLGLLDLPVDLDELAAQREKLYDTRREVGRDRDKIGDVTVDPDLPAEEQSATELLNMIQARKDRNREIESAKNAVAVRQAQMKSIADEIRELQDKLADARNSLKEEMAHVEFLGDPQPTDEWEEQLSSVEESNAAIRLNNQLREQAAEKVRLVGVYDGLTAQIEELDKKRKQAIDEAALPVPGLDIGSDDLVFEGVPFASVNRGHKLRIALRVLAALDPVLRVVQIREGSLLDKAGRAELGQFAEEFGFQVWLETVDGEGGIILSEGEIL